MLLPDYQRIENQRVVPIEKWEVKHKHWSQRVAAKTNMAFIKQIPNDYKSTNSTSKQKTDRTANMNRGMEATQTSPQRLVGAWQQPSVLTIHLKSWTKQLWNRTTATGIIRNKRMVGKEWEKVSGPLNRFKPDQLYTEENTGDIMCQQHAQHSQQGGAHNTRNLKVPLSCCCLHFHRTGLDKVVWWFH